jgi:hypothetical protein
MARTKMSEPPSQPGYFPRPGDVMVWMPPRNLLNRLRKGKDIAEEVEKDIPEDIRIMFLHAFAGMIEQYGSERVKLSDLPSVEPAGAFAGLLEAKILAFIDEKRPTMDSVVHGPACQEA